MNMPIYADQGFWRPDKAGNLRVQVRVNHGVIDSCGREGREVIEVRRGST